MSGSTLNILALLAALVVGYGIWVSSGEPEQDANASIPIVQGYYLKNAVITETDESGAPRMRLAAAVVQQDSLGNTVNLSDVTASADATSAHWAMTAAHGHIPAQSKTVVLNGSVVAHTVDAPRSVVVRTQSLSIDTQQQSANTDDAVVIDVGGYQVTGQGLAADLPSEHLRISGPGELRLAAQATATPSESESKISLPGVFDNEGVELRNGGIRLKKVRSRTEPFVQADEAIASSTDLDNNRFTLRGDVRFDLPQQGNLRAESAIVTVNNSRIVHAVASGQPGGEPVRFEHHRKTVDKQTNEATVESAHGRAQTIDYNVDTGVLNFKGDVWFSIGRYEWCSEEWQYNLTDGSGSSTRRSTTTVHPREVTSSAAKPCVDARNTAKP